MIAHALAPEIIEQAFRILTTMDFLRGAGRFRAAHGAAAGGRDNRLRLG